MPLPNPKPKEEKDIFLSRCINDNVMKDEFPDGKQRFVICLKIYVHLFKYIFIVYIFYKLLGDG